MKNLGLFIMTLSLLIQIALAEAPRDIKKYPLSLTELKALEASKAMAEKHGEVVDPRCVNASYGPGSVPVNIQFLTEGDEGQAACIDPHFSIEVEFTKKGEIKAMNLIDT